LVSKALFISEKVTVQGFKWCKSAPKEVGLANVTAKILCRKHNTELSPIDDAGAAAFDVFRQSTRLTIARAKVRTNYLHVETFRLNGPGLERWFLKTLINVAYGHDYRIGRDSTVPGEPSPALVEVAFGKRAFEGRAGLYQVAHAGQQIHSSDTVKFTPLIKDGHHIDGCLFAFRGFRYLLFLGVEGLTTLPRGIGQPGEDWSISQLNYHLAEMRAMINGRLSHVIRVKW
jgi:hypothetical protein